MLARLALTGLIFLAGTPVMAQNAVIPPAPSRDDVSIPSPKPEPPAPPTPGLTGEPCDSQRSASGEQAIGGQAGQCCCLDVPSAEDSCSGSRFSSDGPSGPSPSRPGSGQPPGRYSQPGTCGFVTDCRQRNSIVPAGR